MIGIASLQSAQNPGQAPMGGMMPGQAPMPGQMPGQIPGMMPKPGAATPEAEVSQYQGMNLPELIAQFQRRPSGPLLGLITKQTQEAELQKAQANQAAMAQAQQQQGTVKDMAIGKALQALQPTQMAQGGIMQGYAGGGAVAFEDGGRVQHFKDGANEFGLMANPEAEAMDALRVELAQKDKQRKALEETYYSLMMQGDPRAAQVKQQLDALSGSAPMSSPAVAPARQPLFPPEAIALMQRQGPRGIASVNQPSSSAATRGVGQLAQASSRAQPSALNVVKPAIQADMTPEERQVYESQRAMLEGRRNRPESLTRAEQGLADLARANIEAQQREAEEFRREAMERRDAGLARAQQSIWSNPQAMLALAGGIDTRRGQGVSSFARGLANIMGQQESMAEAARKEYAQAQQMQRTLDAAIRNTQVLEAQRQVAMQQADFGRVSQLDDQIQNSRAAEEAAKRSIRDKAIDQARQERLAVADEGRTRAALISANKPPETLALLQAMFPGQAPSVENLKQVSEARNPTGAGRLAIAQERNEIARQNLLAKDMGYQTASMRHNMATDPAKKAQFAAVMREIERRNGIVTEDEQITSVATQLPAGVKVTRVGP